MRMTIWLMVVLLAGALAVVAAHTGIDPAHKYAWGENVGWLSAQSLNHDLTVHYYEGSNGWLSGYIWGENIGWIVMGSAGGGPYANTGSNNWGVNVAASGKLSGYALGENVGWIKFKGTSPDYGVRSMAFYTQPHGTPNWWLDYHGVNEDYESGDGVPAWQKYVMDTDPNVAGHLLRITAVSNGPAAKLVTFTPASTRRYYTLARNEDLMGVGWSNVIGQVSVPGTGGDQSMQDTNTAARAFYGVKVSVEP